MTSSKRPFSLLEITLACAILAIAGGLLTWQIRGLISRHTFHKSVDAFSADLRRGELVALAKRIDLEMHITRSKKGYAYRLSTDEPLKEFPWIEQLKGVERISMGGVPIEEVTLKIYHSGWVMPQEAITLFSRGKSVQVDLHLRDKAVIIAQKNRRT